MDLSIEAALHVAIWLINIVAPGLMIGLGTSIGAVLLMWAIGQVKAMDWKWL